MEVGYIVFRSGASLDEVETCALVNYDKRMLKLTCALRVESEIRLERIER